jgi:hypothetical protein
MPDNRFWRDSSQRLTFEMFRVPSGSYATICGEIIATFQLVPHVPLIVGFDGIYGEHRRDEQIVGLDWDVWCGFTVTAKNEAAEPLVREIAEYLFASLWADVGTTS